MVDGKQNNCPVHILREETRGGMGGMFIKCNGDTITVYDPYNYFDQINLNSSSIKYEKMKDQQFYKIFYDSTNKEYINLSSEHL
jgi:membrane protease subunit (stomatin/prohibitin family)